MKSDLEFVRNILNRVYWDELEKLPTETFGKRATMSRVSDAIDNIDLAMTTYPCADNQEA